MYFFQRAVVTPILNLEALWREYNAFEQVCRLVASSVSMLCVDRCFVWHMVLDKFLVIWAAAAKCNLQNPIQDSLQVQ